MKLIKTVDAHCDLFCGVYDQAVYNTVHKYNESDDDVFKQRCILIKEERAQLVKEHLWVLWTDYFKPPHVEKFPQLHDLFWRATKAAGETKKSTDQAVAQKLLDLVDEIGEIFAQTKEGYDYKTVVKNLS